MPKPSPKPTRTRLDDAVLACITLTRTPCKVPTRIQAHPPFRYMHPTYQLKVTRSFTPKLLDPDLVELDLDPDLAVHSVVKVR